MKIIFWGITWAAAQNFFIAFPIVIVAVLLLVWRLKKTRAAIKVLSQFDREKKLFTHVRPGRNVLKVVLEAGGLIFLFLALLRPQWDKKEQNVVQEGRDLFIAFDISRSMLVQDYKPDRLEFAKKKVKALLEHLDCERVGLILFSGSTCVQCPLTNDYAAFFMFLDQFDVETISSGTTAIDQAIKKALNSFRSMPTRKSKLLVLLTDGEDFSSNLAGVRSEAAAQGLTIFTLGVGTPDGGPIPTFDEDGNAAGYQKDKDGKVIISRLNEGILHNLAQQTGGVYLRATYDDADIKTLTGYIQKFEKERFGDKEILTLQEKYPHFLAGAFVCFLLEWLL